MSAAGGFATDEGVLGAMASSMRSASDTIEALAPTVPSTAGTGPAAGQIADILADLLKAAVNLSMDGREAADRLDASRSAYAVTDLWAVLDMPGMD